MTDITEDVLAAEAGSRQLYIEQQTVQDALEHKGSGFHEFCRALSVPATHLQQWKVAGEPDSKQTLFFQTDLNGQYVNRRRGLYDASGTLKSKKLFHLQQPKEGQDRYGHTLYGLHNFRGKPIMLTRDEASAVVGAYFYDQYDWLSTCGASIKDEDAQWLQDKTVTLVKDANSAQKIERKLAHYFVDFQVVDLLAERQDNSTFATFIKEQKDSDHGQLPNLELHKQDPSDSSNFDIPEDQAELFEKYGFYIKENCYYSAKSEGKAAAISNFYVEPFYLIKNKDQPKRLVQLVNQYNHRVLLDVRTEDFTSLDRFNSVVESEGNFLFEGNKADLNKIKRHLYEQMPSCTEVTTLGWNQAGFFTFCNGVYGPDQSGNWQFKELSQYGIVEHEDAYYFIPFTSKVYSEDDGSFEEEKKFRYDSSSISWVDWTQLFTRVYGDNGKVALLFYVASMFRDIIFPKTQGFPHLFAFGPPQTGKSKLGWSIFQLYYEPGNAQKPQSLSGQSTTKSFIRKAEQKRNCIQWFEEYKNSVKPEKIETLKNLYDGIGYDRAVYSGDARTISSQVLSSFYISGQQMPTADNALFTRCILLPFNQTEFSQDEVNQYERLKQIEQEYSLTHITAQLNQYRQLIREQFNKVWPDAVQEFKAELEAEGVEQRMYENYTILLAVFRILRQAITFPFDDAELKQLFIDRIRDQHREVSTTKDVAVFWDVVEFLLDNSEQVAMERDIKLDKLADLNVITGRKDEQGKDQYRDALADFVEKPRTVLLIRLKNIHQAYMEAHKRQHGTPGLKLNDIAHYLRNDNAYLGTAKSYSFENSRTSAMAFDYSKLEEQGVNLLRDAESIQHREDQERTAPPEQPKETPIRNEAPF
jgi:hypothetical protein